MLLSNLNQARFFKMKHLNHLRDEKRFSGDWVVAVGERLIFDNFSFHRKFMQIHFQSGFKVDCEKKRTNVDDFCFFFNLRWSLKKDWKNDWNGFDKKGKENIIELWDICGGFEGFFKVDWNILKL